MQVAPDSTSRASARRRGEVQVGEEGVVGAQPGDLLGLGLLDLDDQLGGREDRVGVGSSVAPCSA
jgi:hypothetical protein